MTDTATGLRGPELMRAVINQIIEHPETWNQREWHCGTAHCFGGWCQVLGGWHHYSNNNHQVLAEVGGFLGLNIADVNWLCDRDRTLRQLQAFAEQYIANKTE